MNNCPAMHFRNDEIMKCFLISRSLQPLLADDRSAASSPLSFPSHVCEDQKVPQIYVRVTNLIQHIIAKYELLSSGQTKVL